MNTQTNVTLPERWKEILKAIAEVISAEEEKNIKYTDLIRRAVESEYGLGEIEEKIESTTSRALEEIKKKIELATNHVLEEMEEKIELATDHALKEIKKVIYQTFK